MSDQPERQTRFRGEGRPKRRHSPSPQPKAATPKSTGPKVVPSASKTPLAKPRKSTDPTPTPQAGTSSKKSQIKETKNAVSSDSQQPAPAAPLQYQADLQSGRVDLMLQHSRQKWLLDGIFEKYWTKYSRKKQEEGGASKESMTKLSGECTMIIEPHSFKITLFSVRSASTAQTQTQTSTPQASMSPVPQTQPTAPQTNPKPPAQTQQPPPAPPGSNSPISATPAATPSAPSTIPPDAPPISGQPTPTASKPSQPPSVEPIQPVAEPTKPAAEVPPRPPPAAPVRTEAAGNMDPVIQLLAARAASDHKLKTLMKTVAQGHATQEELTVFQRHIDELNDYIQAKKRQNGQDSAAPILPPAYTPSKVPDLQPAPLRPGVSQYGSPAIPRYPQPSPTYYQSPVSFVKPKAPAVPKSILSGVVFEFAEANGTRYMLPRNSIIEFLRGSMEVQMSFLVVRNGNKGLGEKYDEGKQYYLPVNIRLVAESPRLLDMLPKIVAPADEVCKYMEEVMESSELAEDIYIGSQLPPRKEEKTSGDEDTTNGREEKLLFGAPNSMIPL